MVLKQPGHFMCIHQLSPGLDWTDRCWLPNKLSNLEFSCAQLSSYMRTHYSFFFFFFFFSTFQECCDGSPVFRLCWASIFVKVDDFWHQCQRNVEFFIRFMASVMPDARTYLLTGARINLTLLHLCSCFSGYPLSGKKNLGVWVLKQLLVSFISDF